MNQKISLVLVVYSMLCLLQIRNANCQVSKLKDSLLGYYSFDDGSFKDLSGNNLNGVAYGNPKNVLRIPKNYAKNFNGTSDYIRIADNPKLHLESGSAWSVSFWYLSHSQTALQPMVVKMTAGTGSANSDYYIFSQNGLLYWGTGTSADKGAWLNLNAPDTGTWHHIAMTYKMGVDLSGNPAAIKNIWIDGKLEKTVYAYKKAVTNEDLTIGYSNDGNGKHYFKGILDEVRIYNRELSQSDILMLAGKWRIDGGVTSVNSPQSPVCEGTVKIKISLKNFGTDTLTSMKVRWSVDGQLQSAYSWTGSVANFDLDTSVLLGNLTLTGNSLYKLKFWTENPNGIKDTFNNNDTITLNVKSNPLPNVNWKIGSHAPGSKTYQFVPSDTTYGYYEWNLGDGFKSNLKIPSYTYSKDSSFKVSLIVKNSFGCASSHDSVIKIQSLGIEGNLKSVSNFRIFPNPSNQNFKLSFSLEKSAPIRIEISDLAGNVIVKMDEGILSHGSHELELDQVSAKIANGVYLVTLKVGNEAVTLKYFRF